MATIEEIQRKILVDLQNQLEDQLKILKSTKKRSDEYSKRTQTEIDSINDQLKKIDTELKTIDEKDLVDSDSKLEDLVTQSENNLEAQEDIRTKITNLEGIKDEICPIKKSYRYANCKSTKKVRDFTKECC